METTKTEGRKLIKYVSDYCVFDLETTGTSWKTDEVVEISAVKVKGGQVVDEFTTLVNPGCPIPYRASLINGITDNMVADAPAFDIALKDFLDFVGDMILVGHNIHTFDMKFIKRDAEKFWGKAIFNDYVDTLPLSRAYLPKLDHHTLSDLAAHYDIATDGAHRALFDCRMNQQVYEFLGKEIEHPSKEAMAIPKCPWCGNVLKKRNGKYGEFWGCGSYPECNFTRNV